MRPEEISPLLLAYLGDAVMEVLVRERLIQTCSSSGECNRNALSFVTAKSQAAAARRIRPFFTPDEAEIFQRARNAKSHSAPRNVDLYSYRLATALEAVFGWNSLHDGAERNRALFALAFPPEPVEEGEKQENEENV